MIKHDAIFTNVARNSDNEPWWENKKVGEPAIDWQGRPYDSANGKASASDIDSWLRAVDSELTGNRDDLSRSENRILHGFGSGTLSRG